MPALGNGGKIKTHKTLARSAQLRSQSRFQNSQTKQALFFPSFVNLKWPKFEVCCLVYHLETGFCAYLISQKLGGVANIYATNTDFAPTMMHTVRELALQHGAAILVRAQNNNKNSITEEHQKLLAHALNQMAGKIKINDANAMANQLPHMTKILNPSLCVTNDLPMNSTDSTV